MLLFLCTSISKKAKKSINNVVLLAIIRVFIDNFSKIYTNVGSFMKIFQFFRGGG